MKTNDYLLAFATAAYSYLFYDQNAGINFLVFTSMFLIMTVYRDPTLLKNKKWQWGAAMCLVSSAGILMHSSALAVFANIVSLLLVSAFSFKKETSAAFSLLFSLYSLLISAAVIINNLMTTNGDKEQKQSGGIYKFVGVGVVFILTVIFLALYRESNPLFALNTSWVNLNFISFGWMAFTGFGFLIIYGLYYHRTLSTVEVWENSLSLKNIPETQVKSVKLETERNSGLVLFALLNLMLIILNGGDIKTLWLGASLPAGMTNSDFVHQGVEAIIFSIIMATGLIMFLFRKDFVNQKFTGFLKLLVALWILQTLFMLISAAFRNKLYIQQFDLTYNRIGVYVWLILAVVGLALTTDKIFRERSNWYLIKTNVAVWFTILSAATLMNWDLLITQYNLKYTPLKNVDFDYLFSLSDSNLPELIAVTELKHFPEIKTMKNISFQEKYHKQLHNKINSYIHNYTNDWQSWDLVDSRITKSLIK